MTKRKSEKAPAVPTVLDLVSATVSLDGRTMSVREAQLRVLYNQSLNKDIDAAIELQNLRDACGVDDQPERLGCLLVPEPVTEELFEKLAYEQQAQFRERNYGRPDI